MGGPAEQSQLPSDDLDVTTHTTSEQECLHDQSMSRCICSAFKAATSDLWAHVAAGKGARLNPMADDELADDAPRAFDVGI